MEQVFALQVDARLAGTEVTATGQRSRPAGISGEQLVELGLEAGVATRGQERVLEFGDCRNEDLGDIGAAKAPEAAGHQHDALLDGARSSANRAATLSGSFSPGAHSIRELTSRP